MIRSTRAPLGYLVYAALMSLAGLYFVFAAVQGDYGIFRRAEVKAEAKPEPVKAEAKPEAKKAEKKPAKKAEKTAAETK